MKKILLYFFSLSFLFVLTQSCEKTSDLDTPTDELELKSAKGAKQSYIVVLNDTELNEELTKLKGYEKKQLAVKTKSDKILQRAGITDGEVGFVYGSALQGFSVKIAPGQLKKLEIDPSVKYIEEDQIITLGLPDFKINKGKPVKPDPTPEPDPGTSTQETPWGITRVNGGISGATGTAWVIDTGIDLDHPDLNIDASRSVNFTRASSPDDDNGHGSHVAGTIAAIDNNFGVIGVAAGAELVAVKVLDRRGSGSTSGVIAGINYVAANASGNDVANMSLGGGVSSSLDAAVLAASSTCTFVLAAGNESDDANNHSPARVNGNNIITVSAMWETDRFATEFSNYGNPPIDYAAPGVYILSCYKNGGYDTLHGTSMATPHVAGLVLLGAIRTDGRVSSDPDGNADYIAVH
jgi:subtilisin family serine protease